MQDRFGEISTVPEPDKYAGYPLMSGMNDLTTLTIEDEIKIDEYAAI